MISPDNIMMSDLLMYSQAKEGVEIKGCCFRHTAATEQYMSEFIDQLLNKHAIPVGNRPAAMWKYSIPEEPLPKVCKITLLVF